MVLGSYPDRANSASKYSDLLPGRKCLPGQSLIITTVTNCEWTTCSRSQHSNRIAEARTRTLFATGRALWPLAYTTINENFEPEVRDGCRQSSWAFMMDFFLVYCIKGSTNSPTYNTEQKMKYTIQVTTYIQTYIHTYIHIDTHTSVHTYIHAYVTQHDKIRLKAPLCMPYNSMLNYLQNEPKFITIDQEFVETENV